MSLLQTLIFRGLSLLVVLITVLFLAVIVLGATGYSDRLLTATVSEELRGLRQSLSQNIRDPSELERVIEDRREQLIEFYGLDRPWYYRLPDMLFRILTLDLGEARTLRSFTGSNRVSDIVLERLPNTILLITSATIITSIIGLYVGVKIATQVGSRLERSVSYFSAISYALPAWWLGIIFIILFFFFFQAEDGIRDSPVTGVQTCALPIYLKHRLQLCMIYDANGLDTLATDCYEQLTELAPDHPRAWYHLGHLDRKSVV